MSFTQLRPRPSPQSINTGLRSCPTKLLVHRHGMPGGALTDHCGAITKPYWKGKIVTANVGPFNLTGHKLFLDVIREALKEVKEVFPELYEALGTAGCLCYRRVRNTENTLSNHGLGFAVDFTIEGKLDQRGDNQVFNGSLMLYSILKKYKIFWGAGFSTEDGMHFEASQELVEDWIKEGVL